MDPASYLINLGLNAVGSTLAQFSYGWLQHRQSPEKAASEFNRRAANFNLHIELFLKEVLLRINPELGKHLLEYEIEGQKRLLPVVPLIKSFGSALENEPVSISSTIARERDGSARDDDLIAFIRATGRNIVEGPGFRLLAVGKHRELVVGLTSYFRAMSSCDKYYFNTIRFFPERPSVASLYILRHHPLYKSWKDDINRIILSKTFSHLSAAMGISVFTVFSKGTGLGYTYPCIRNSNEKNGAADRHVIPSFMFEPMTEIGDELEAELDIEYQVLREFGEEILGRKEFQRTLDWRAVHGMILNDPACNALYELLKTGGATLEITGLWLDVFRLRPEISCVLLIKDPDYYEEHRSRFVGNWEQKHGVAWADLVDRKTFFQLLSDPEAPMCPPGIGAMISGREYCIKHLGLEE